jgi:rhodanese-related sulfurtransferase
MKVYLYLLIVFIGCNTFAQKTIPEVLEKFNKKTVPYILVSDLKNETEFVLLDAREIKEFNTSHIKNSIFIGFNKFNKKTVLTSVPNKNAKIIVYCSIGLRSEQIGEKLIKMGYNNVRNLYGGIFEWKNNNEQVVDNQNAETQNIHTFSKEWAIYLKKGIKVYE